MTDPEGVSLSTHVLDSSAGGGRPGVVVSVVDASGATVASAPTDATGRITTLAEGLEPGTYTIRWATGGSFVTEAAVTVHLAAAGHAHVPLLASDHSATVYLGA